MSAITEASNPSSFFLPGMALGGALISSLGAGSTVFLEGKNPSAKSLVRDFIIGAVMVILIMQLLPESMSSLIQFVLALAPTTLFSSKALSGGGNGSVAVLDDMEVKVGVPRF